MKKKIYCSKFIFPAIRDMIVNKPTGVLTLEFDRIEISAEVGFSRAQTMPHTHVAVRKPAFFQFSALNLRLNLGI